MLLFVFCLHELAHVSKQTSKHVYINSVVFCMLYEWLGIKVNDRKGES